MGAANLDKMVEKNRECVGGEILKMCGAERRKEMEISTARALARPAGGCYKAGNLWYRFLLRTGTKDPLVPVRDTNRYQRLELNRYQSLPAHCTFEPVPKPPLVPVRKHTGTNWPGPMGGFLVVPERCTHARWRDGFRIRTWW